MLAIKRVKDLFHLPMFNRSENITVPVMAEEEKEGEEFIDEFYLEAVREQERRKERIQRLLKLRRYYQYFNVRKRYGIKFKEFVRRVDNGTWYAWKAD